MKDSKQVLTSVLHTAQMGQSGIHAVIDRAVNPELQLLLQEQLTEYKTIEVESRRLAARHGWEIPPRNKVLAWMSTTGAKCRLLVGETDSIIAGMLIQGNTRGMILGIKNLKQTQGVDESVETVANKLLNLENVNIQKSQEFL